MAKRQVAKQPTFESRGVVAEFLAGYAYSGSPKTHANYQQVIERNLLPFLERNGVDDLQTVTPALLVTYLQQASRRFARTTLLKHYESLRRFFSWCVEEGYLDRSPAARLPRPKLPDTGRVGFDREEVARLIKWCGHKESQDRKIAARDRAIILFMLGTACRADELLKLRKQDIDWPRRRVLLHGKGGKDRWVPLGPKVSTALRTWLRVRERDCDEIWITQRGSVMGHATLWAMLHALGEYAGVENVHPHRFRHTAATEMYREHRDVLLVQHYLGHSRVETTTGYLRQIGIEFRQATYTTPVDWLG